MKRILYILALMAIAGSLSCKKTAIDTDKGNIDQGAKTPVELGITGINVSTIQNAPASRTIGGIMDELSDFSGEKIAAFGVTELFSDGTQLWKPSERLFSTESATIEINPTTSVGTIDYYGSDPTKKAYYPEGGYLNVYALYPASTEYLKIVEPAVQGTPPSANVILATKLAEQYDILHGATEKLTVAQAQKAEVTFAHALAQLKFKIYKEDNTITARVSKITVKGVGKASLADIRKAEFTLSSDVLDIMDFEVYNGATTEITAITKESAVSIGDILMLFPGTASVSLITVTIDGQDYTTPIPTDWNLNQGKINTITLRINKFGVRPESQWTVSAWGKGQGVDQGLENNGKFIRVSAPLVNGDKTAYSGALAPVLADITISGYTHKGITVQYDAVGKKLTTEWFNSGSLNNEPIYLEGLTLYDNNALTIFDGVLKGGIFSSNQKIEIDTIKSGALKVNNEALALDMDFGGLGDGSVNIPYQVSTPTHLDNIRKYMGSASGTLTGTPSKGAYFVQINDINLGAHLSVIHNGTTFISNPARQEPFIGSAMGWTPIGDASTPFYGNYDGQGYKLSGLYINLPSSNYVGLFGSVGVVTQSLKNSVSNLTVSSGHISGSSYIGSIAGASAVTITSCHNYADLKAFKNSGATNIGGLIGSLTTITGIVVRSSNHGSVSSVYTHAGGLVGMMAAATKIEESFNAGKVSANDYVGGLVATCPGGNVINSYNRGDLSVVLSTGDLVIGGIAASINKITTIKNSYNRATITNSTNKFQYSGSLVGFVSQGLSANHQNNHFLAQPPLKGIGSVVSTSGVDYPEFTSQTEASLKALSTTLGSSWINDDPIKNINEGYPILVWQK